MRRNREQFVFGGAMVLILVMSLAPAFSQAAEWVHEGMAEEGNKWFRLGMMLEWESHGIDGPRSGSVDTITLLPVNLEYRPGHFGNFIPYFTTGLGVNINTKDVKDTFAWRIGGGIDYALTNLVQGAPKGLMLNMEAAWKRNHPDSDGSTMGLLFGVRHTF